MRGFLFSGIVAATPLIVGPVLYLHVPAVLFLFQTKSTNMKRIKLVYWITTILFAGFMLFTAIPDIMLSKDAVTFMKDYLGYPNYFTVFIGVAKALGCIAIVVPGLNRIKEWAYAGLFFDLAGAVYSITAVSGFQAGTLVIVLTAAVGAISYISWRKLFTAVAAG